MGPHFVVVRMVLTRVQRDFVSADHTCEISTVRATGHRAFHEPVVIFSSAVLQNA